MPDSLPPTPPARQTALDWALHYMRLGWSVVPVRPPEKLPAVPWARRQTQPADEAAIRTWFDSIKGCGVGLVQGAHVGTIVLDFDGEDGAATQAHLEARGLPMAPTSLTGSGGAHVILRHPGRYVPTRKKVLPGMDVRGDGGFIVAPPSIHGVLREGGYVASGRAYAWDVDAHPDDVVVPDCPEWLAEIICGEAPTGTVQSTEIVRNSTAQVQDGREQYMRDTILAVCREMRDGLGRLPTETELIEAAWPQYAAHVDFSRPGRGRAEFDAKVRYTLGRAHVGAVKALAPPAQSADFSADLYPDAAPDNKPDNKPDKKPKAEAKPPLPLIYFSDVAANLDCADFVEGVLTERAMSVVYGESNAGKTFFVTDLAIHVATGRKWRGREIEAGGVVYCALEGRDGISNRIAAFKKEHGLEGCEVPFAVIPVPINLLDPAADREHLRDAVRLAADEMGAPVKLVVVDTLSRAMAGGNENAPDDMGALVASADYIRQEVAAHILFIHHSGKDAAKGARGHSLLRAATDTEIEVSRPEDAPIGTAKVTKQRDLPKGDLFYFTLKVVELGMNRRKKPVTSCIVEAAEQAAEASRGTRRLSTGQKEALGALQEALIEGGRTAAGQDIPQGVRVVPINAWRSAFYARSVLDTQEAKQKAFVRGSKALQEAGLIGVRNNVVWTVGGDE